MLSQKVLISVSVLVVLNLYLIQAAVNPCSLRIQTGNCGGRAVRYGYNYRYNYCKKFFFTGCDGNANNFRTLASCKRRCVKKPDPCIQDIRKGYCRDPTRVNVRVGYNSRTNKCQKFRFSGCDGNANNFRTFASCEKRCVKRDPCNHPKKVGPCNTQRLLRYYFNNKLNRCIRFYWGGCRPNFNNFKTLTACRRRCPPRRCRQGIKPGVGRLGLRRYGYNLSKRRCVSFRYRGSRGNSNRFGSMAACRKVCMYIQPRTRYCRRLMKHCYGWGITHFAAHNRPNNNLCKAVCNANSNCKAMTYNRSLKRCFLFPDRPCKTVVNGNKFYLFTRMNPPVHPRVCKSLRTYVKHFPVRYCRRSMKHCYGRGITHFARFNNRNNRDLCKALCNNDNRCKAITYNRQLKACFLFPDVPCKQVVPGNNFDYFVLYGNPCKYEIP